MLIILDVDGTLTPDMTGVLFDSNVVEKLMALRGTGVKLALASNQGGVGLRHWIESAGGFGKTAEEKEASLLAAAKYPTLQESMSRLATVAGNVTALTYLPVKIYASFAYQSKGGNWGPTPYDLTSAMADNEKDPRAIYEIPPEWSQQWRKPNAGMLLQAMADWNELPENTIMVGNSAEDKGAALAAGIDFIHADEYFMDVYKEAFKQMGDAPLELDEAQP